MSHARVVKNTAFMLASFVGQKVLSLVYFTIIARYLGAAGTGEYFTALSFTTLFGVAIDLGVANVITREFARDRTSGERQLRAALGVRLAFAAAAYVAVQVAAALMGYPPSIRMLIALSGVVMMLDAFHLVFYAALRGLQDLRYEAAGMMIGQGLTIFCGLMFARAGLPVPWLVVALLIGSTWSVVYSLVMLRRRGVRPGIALRGSGAKALLVVATPFAVAAVLSRFYGAIDTLMLSKLSGAAEVGYYGAAYKATFAFQFVPVALSSALYPAMSASVRRDRAETGRLLSFAVRMLAFAALPIVIGLVMLAPAIIRAVYGHAFKPAEDVLMVIAPTLLFAFPYWPFGSLLNAADRQRRNALALAATIVVNAVLDLLLIPTLGGVGAGIASVASNFVLLCAAVWLSRGVADTRVLREGMGRALVAWLVSGGVMAGVMYAMSGQGLLARAAVGGLAYAVALLVTGGIRPSDRESLLSALRRPGRDAKTADKIAEEEQREPAV